jgi:hypothetical protein
MPAIENSEETSFEPFQNIDRFLRIIAYILSKWQQNHPQNAALKNDPILKKHIKEELPNYLADKSDAIPIIHFEKMLTFTYRFWNYVAAEEKKDITSNPKKRKFSHNLTFATIADAKHGPRLQLIPTKELTDSRHGRFFNQILFSLQQEGLLGT